jgi:flavin reductase (DIM6/NTAB) family NADH-FMN oxidoreductase RutF
MYKTITPNILYFGTPVVLLSTENPDGTWNLAPMSSAWALGQVVVLGLGPCGQTAANLAARPELVINLPSPQMWESVERLAPHLVRPPRVDGCPLQLEAVASRVQPDAKGDFVIVEASVRRVHAHEEIVLPGTSHVDTGAWQPLIYTFRHYFGLGARLGRSFRAEY